MITHGVEQRDARLDLQIDGLSVDVEADGYGTGAGNAGSRRRGFGIALQQAGARCADAHSPEEAPAAECAIWLGL